MNSLANLYAAQGEYARAEDLFSRALEAGRRGLGENHPFSLDSMRGLADVDLKQGKYSKAGPLYTSVLQNRRRVLGEEHPDTLSALVSLSRLLLRQQKYGEAEAKLREALETYEKAKIDVWERYHCQKPARCGFGRPEKVRGS